MSKAGKQPAVADKLTVTTDGRDDLTCKIWKTRPSPLHGIGLFTRCDIKEGEHVSAKEKTELQRSVAAQGSARNTEELNSESDDTSEKRNDDTQKPTSAYQRPLSPRYPTINHLATPLGQRVFPFYGDPETRRHYNHVHLLNHSCDPNAEAVWNPETGRLVVRAICDFEASEEITIPYVSLLAARADRWVDLGFHCMCEACRMEDQAIRWSDNIRIKLAQDIRILRHLQVRLFGSTTDDLKVTTEIACGIQADDKIFKLLDKLLSANASPKLEFNCSELMPIFETAYQASHLQAAFEIKLHWFDHLARSSGVEHPRSRQVLSRLLRMANAWTGRENKKVKKSMLKAVRTAVAKYKWEVEIGTAQRGEEVLEPIAALEWDEQATGKQLLDVVLVA
ncbi:hypothetical protein LTR08_002852 [Meristemomyces frigidus]|nr:hypothetical protein LTR08_002852 [Meristemomyces frigidus]